MTHRIEQINELIKKELGGLFVREIEFPPETVVTITKVSTDAELKTARVFVVVQPSENTAKALKMVRKSARMLQHELIHTLSMHFVPRISFSIDPNPDEHDVIDDIFRELDKERTEDK